MSPSTVEVISAVFAADASFAAVYSAVAASSSAICAAFSSCAAVSALTLFSSVAVNHAPDSFAADSSSSACFSSWAICASSFRSSVRRATWASISSCSADFSIIAPRASVVMLMESAVSS